MASREQLYCDYVTELKMYNPNLIFMDNDQIFKNYKEVSSFADLEWIDVYDGVECVGFILLTYGTHCPVNYDWFIMECYVDAKHRRRNLMTKALNQMILSHQGRFGLFILSYNLAAGAFWNHYLSQNMIRPRLEIKQIPVTKTSVSSSVDCYELAFEVSDKKRSNRVCQTHTIPSFE